MVQPQPRCREISRMHRTSSRTRQTYVHRTGFCVRAARGCVRWHPLERRPLAAVRRRDGRTRLPRIHRPRCALAGSRGRPPDARPSISSPSNPARSTMKLESSPCRNSPARSQSIIEITPICAASPRAFYRPVPRVLSRVPCTTEAEIISFQSCS